MYWHILIATDGSELSMRAVEHGVGLARAVDAKITFLTVTEAFHVFTLDASQIEDTRLEFVEHMKARAERTPAAASDVAAANGVEADEGDRPYEVILEIAEARRCDLIIMASHGRRGVSAMLLGSETMKVLTHTTRPVLVVR